MKLESQIKSITNVYIYYDFLASKRVVGDTLTSTSEYFSMTTISSTDYQTVLIEKYRVEDAGYVSVHDIFASLIFDVKGNGSFRWQVSGNEGTTWINIYESTFNEVGYTAYDVSGSGTWISTIDAGNNKFQVRLQVKAVAGNIDINVSDESYITVSYRKKVLS